MHILVDTYDAFGGLASAMLEELADDYVNKGILVFGVSPSSFKNNVSLYRSAFQKDISDGIDISGCYKECLNSRMCCCELNYLCYVVNSYIFC